MHTAGLIKARALPLTAVRLTGGPLKHAQDLTGRNLTGHIAGH